MIDLELRTHDTGLVVVDVQQKLAAAMPEQEVTRAIRNWTSLVEMAARLHMPVAVSEQYPRGLGPTLPVLREVLGKVTPPPRFVEKVDFSCCAAPLFEQLVNDSGRHTWIVVGMECHVCVYQTARGLLDRGFNVHVPADAVLSRTKQNWKVGLKLMDDAGVVVTSTETALFDLVKRGEGETFKALSRLVK
jgi:nicotinamidase-related amidase